MALLSLTNGLAYQNSGETPGFDVKVGASYGTKGAAPFWRRRRTNKMTSFTPDPRLAAYNVASAITWRATVNNATAQANSQATPSASAVFTTPAGAALAK